jgi:hypothetical protein
LRGRSVNLEIFSGSPFSQSLPRAESFAPRPLIERNDHHT